MQGYGTSIPSEVTNAGRTLFSPRELRWGKPRLTNTVALAALRSRRYLSRYFSFWLFLGSLFILALPDSGVRGSGARPLNTLMVWLLLGGLRAAEGMEPRRTRTTILRTSESISPRRDPPEVAQKQGHV